MSMKNKNYPLYKCGSAFYIVLKEAKIENGLKYDNTLRFCDGVLTQEYALSSYFQSCGSFRVDSLT